VADDVNRINSYKLLVSRACWLVTDLIISRQRKL